MRMPYLWLAVVFLANPLDASDPVPLEQVDHAIHLAADYLNRQSLEDGRFVYRINLNPDVVVTPTYNLVRHAGAMYALADYQQFRPSDVTVQVLERAGKFLQSQIHELKEVPDLQAVWSDPRVTHADDQVRAKLGGTGLGLIALTQMEHIAPGHTSKQRLTQLGDFLLFMQKDNGGFFSLYYPDVLGRNDEWTSLYYPGEAALGMLMLYELTADNAYREGTHEALEFLAKSRQGQAVVPADHWALIATARLLANASAANSEMDESLLPHAIQVCRFMLAEQKPQNETASLAGCFVPDGRTTPTATRLEGLLATHSVLSKKQERLRTEIENACHAGIRFLIRAQIQTGAAQGGVPRAIATLPSDDPGWSDAFNQRATEIRVDYAQHALSAFLLYRKQFHR